MNYLALTTDEVALVILAICIVPIAILMIYAIVVAIRRSNKTSVARKLEIESNHDDSQKDLFFHVYGGFDNIQDVKIEMSRISVTVVDIEKVVVEELKELGANGVLLVDNVVKCSFGDRAPYIYKILTDGRK